MIEEDAFFFVHGVTNNSGFQIFAEKENIATNKTTLRESIKASIFTFSSFF